MTKQMKTAFSFLRNGPHRIVDTLSMWHVRSEGRRRLKALNEHMLSDIGLIPADADKLARTPFWKP